MSGIVAVVGSVNVDFFVSVPTLPARGETVIGGEHWREQGGKGANQAVAARRAGAAVALIGSVGSDDLGRGAVAALEREGVETRWLRTIEGQSTGIALVMVGPSGENLIALSPGANSHVTAADVESALDVLHPTVVLANLEVPDACVVAAARGAKRAGATFVLNPAPYRPLCDELLSLVDVLTPNEQEAALLGHRRRSREALYRSLSARGLRHLVVTLGERGAQLLSPDGVVLVPAPSAPVVDTTGAGDAFSGVLAASLAAGTGIEESVREAVSAGTMASLQRGARAGLPTRAQLREFRSAVALPVRRARARRAAGPRG